VRGAADRAAEHVHEQQQEHDRLDGEVHQLEQDADDGGLAGPVRAEEPEDGAAGNGQVDAAPSAG
jgi:hypothetical protein